MGWSHEVLDDLSRFKAIVIGPGLGRDEGTVSEARRIIAGAHIPMVIDGDGLFAVAWGGEGARDIVRSRAAGTVLTPHDGEYTTLLGYAPSHDRITSARRLASDTNCVCLLKGTTTVVAEPSGEVLMVANGDQRLATAGTGDVLTGMITSLLAQCYEPIDAAILGVYLHGLTADIALHETGYQSFIASDIISYLGKAYLSLGL